MSNTYKNIQQLNQVASHLLQIADPYHQSESWIDDKLVDMVNSLRDIRSFLEYETTQGNYNNPTIDITNTTRSANAMNKFIFANDNSPSNAKKILQNTKQTIQDKSKEIKKKQEDRKAIETIRKELESQQPVNWVRVENPQKGESLVRPKGRFDHLKETPGFKKVIVEEDGTEITIFIPPISVRQKIEKLQQKEQKKLSYQYAKEGKVQFEKGKHDDEIELFQIMLDTIVHQPLPKSKSKAETIRKEILFAESILGKFKPTKSTASNLLKTIIRLAETPIMVQLQKRRRSKQLIIEELNRRIQELIREQNNLPENSPRYKGLQLRIDKENLLLKETISELEKIESLIPKSENSTKQPSIFSTTRPVSEETEETSPPVKTMDEFSRDQLADMYSTIYAPDGTLLPPKQKFQTNYLGWEQETLDGKTVYILSISQMQKIFEYYTNVLFRAQGLSPRSLSTPSSPETEKISGEARRFLDNQKIQQQNEWVSELQNRLYPQKTSEPEISLFDPETTPEETTPEKTTQDPNVSLTLDELAEAIKELGLPTKTSNIKSLLATIRRAQISLKNVRSI